MLQKCCVVICEINVVLQKYVNIRAFNVDCIELQFDFQIYKDMKLTGHTQIFGVPGIPFVQNVII